MKQNNSAPEARLLNQMIRTQSVLMQAHFEPQSFIQFVADEIHLLTPATGVAVELLEGEEMVYRAVTGSLTEHLNLRFPMKGSISGLCIQKNQVLSSEDTKQDPRVNLEACRTVGAGSLVVSPLIYMKKAIGVLTAVSSTPHAFDSVHIQTLTMMAGFIAAGLKQQFLSEEKKKLLQENALIIKQLQETQVKLSHMANHDYLTGLLNRRMFTTILKQTMDKARRKKHLIGLIYLDIDHFKKINAAFGYETGDQLLIKLGSFLRKSVRSYDAVARLGGDEFIILLDELQDKEDAVRVAKEIAQISNCELLINRVNLKITTSMGIALYQGEKISPVELIKQADQALYQVKDTGRNNFRIYMD
jgi:diguanylate cyclase (GGDEF)-like protein